MGVVTGEIIVAVGRSDVPRLRFAVQLLRWRSKHPRRDRSRARSCTGRARTRSVGAIFLTHAAFELLDRLVFVFFHPFAHLAFDHLDVFDPAAQ